VRKIKIKKCQCGANTLPYVPFTVFLKSHPSIIAHCVLISDVSLKIGAVTKMKYLVTEVHFKNPVKGTYGSVLGPH
jgi:hypothetical protein